MAGITPIEWTIGLLTLLPLSGCQGLRTGGEADARDRLQQVAPAFRPEGQRPALPELRSDSGPGNSRADSLLSQPKVEGATHEWAAWRDPAAVEATVNTQAIMVTPEYLGKLAEEMRQHHPALLAARARTNAAGAEVAAVRTWEDPVVHLGGMAADTMMRSQEGDLLYGIEQQLPLFGKPRARRRVAEAGLALEVATEDFRFQTLRRELARAAFRTALADQTVAIGGQDLAWVATTLEALRAQYRTGRATLTELLNLENERSKRTTQLAADRDQLAHQRVSLNRLLDRELLSYWPPLNLPPVAGQVFYNQRLVDFALRYEPGLNVLRQETIKAEAVLAATRRQRHPDVRVGLESRNYTGSGEFRQAMLGVSLNLPWGNVRKYRSDIQRDSERLGAAEQELADAQLAEKEEVHLLTVRIEAARREALLYRDEVLPRSEQALASATAGWRTGEGDFREVLEARRMLLEARLMYARAVADQYELLSDLVLCCGLGDLEALQMIGAEPDLPEETKP